MDRRILEYLPVILRSVPQFAALMAAQQPELEALWSAQDAVLDNQFVVTAAEAGIGRWERILGIYPKDTDGLELRRARVLALLRLKLPYTVRWLRNWLDELCGPGNYELGVTPYTIAIDLGYDDLPQAEKLTGDIVAMLEATRPANMVLDIGAQRRSRGAVLIGGVMTTHMLLEVFPEIDLGG